MDVLYFWAGVFGVGFVASLFAPELIAKSDWEGIEQRARECLAAVHS